MSHQNSEPENIEPENIEQHERYSNDPLPQKRRVFPWQRQDETPDEPPAITTGQHHSISLVNASAPPKDEAATSYGGTTGTDSTRSNPWREPTQPLPIVKVTGKRTTWLITGGVAACLILVVLVVIAVTLPKKSTPTATRLPGPQTLGLYRHGDDHTVASTFYLSDTTISSTTAAFAAHEIFNFGNSTDIPLAGKWLGGSVDYVGVYRPSNATFYLATSNSAKANAVYTFTFGNPHWLPLVGDWTGNGKDSVGVYDPTTAVFYLLYALPPSGKSIAASAANAIITYGAPDGGDIPIAGKWDNNAPGDGIGIYRYAADHAGASTFYLADSNTGGTKANPVAGTTIYSYKFGSYGDIPVVGDWEAIGLDGVGIYRYNSDPHGTGAFYFKNDPTTQGGADFGPIQFGLHGDIPIVGNWK